MIAGLRAELVREPWLNAYRVYLGVEGVTNAMASHVGEDGRIVYKTVERFTVHEPFLTLDECEVRALAEALLAAHHPEDATADALRDTREVRDRLLAIVERGTTS